MKDNEIERVSAWFKYKGRLYVATIEPERIILGRKDGQYFDKQEVYGFIYGKIKRLLKKHRP